MRKLPSLLVAIAIWFTQSVGSSTGARTPALTSLSSSCFTVSFSSIGSRFGGQRIGSASGFSVSCTDPGKVPTSALKMSG